MYRWTSALALLLLTLPLCAADPPKPNTLTPKEVAEGWLLLFDGETTFGWQIDGEANVEKGTLILGGTKATTAQPSTLFDAYELKVHFAAIQGKDKATLKVGLGKPREILDQPPQFGHFHFIFSDGVSHAPLAVSAPAGSQLQLRSVKLKPLDLKPLFNGKDLTGWKLHPGKKSVFAVKDGAINVKDGPGDLQTEGQWADFVLQLECISNGKHLNSGVFFRCRPGEYQQGYEAQVRNQFTAEPTQEYAIEEYDPKTNELKDKKKVKSTAFDYGTGAIYRRMPARKEMSKDGEWFTMTVVAQGRHFATWVNGVQVVDWTDNRPLKDNARNGCMLEKGNISFQGHDPTTDLSFRNIRIAELPGAK